MAEAIHNASRWRSRPVSAVTRPPPPRCGTSSPERSRSNVAGPLLESSTSGRVTVLTGPARSAPQAGSRKAREDPKPVAQQARHQEVRPHVLLPCPAESLSELGVLQDLDTALSRLLRGLDQETRYPVLDL